MVSRFFLWGRGGLADAEADWDAGSGQKVDPDTDPDTDADVNADAGSGRNDDPDFRSRSGEPALFVLFLGSCGGHHPHQRCARVNPR